MANKHITKCSESLVIREVGFQTLRKILHTSGMPVFKKTDKSKCLVRMWGSWHPYILLAKVLNGEATLENGLEFPQNFNQLPR